VTLFSNGIQIRYVILPDLRAFWLADPEDTNNKQSYTGNTKNYIAQYIASFKNIANIHTFATITNKHIKH